MPLLGQEPPWEIKITVFTCYDRGYIHTSHIFYYTVKISPQFTDCNEQENLKIVMENDVIKQTAQYIWKAYNKRRKAMYTAS